ncbi:HAD-IIA family hydrolase [Novosphingobium mangrovi (ex Huang et al. 2023)]|uniref:HAD hydrolase-like protein n=1 Tax=Novosphingobium mangrovi (ex Huang et al. 2023) TaxID=2976432 RepID=A0ABT2I9G9_9SPHN|nr:HAD family hydrolase [Novosphingobium mangrovi (ex Huang et al. 2023)]MCT2401469.1 HAD hydrolase-like protein [Novosphingobium mangrovi (ex Huang et al. 2023)]
MLSVAKGVLLDWDGCIAVDNRILSSAKHLIAQHADRVAIVSNNSTHLPADLEEILARHGIAFARERIFLAGVEALRDVARSGAGRVLLLAAPKMRNFARTLGLRLVRDHPDVVVLMRDARFTYGKLERAANALRQGVPLVVANADRTHPGPGGRVVPETGSLLAALMACSGDLALEPRVIGKPGPLLFERACDGLAIAPGQAVMIGDNPETDGAGASRLGMTPILIGGSSSLGLEDLLEPVVA